MKSFTVLAASSLAILTPLAVIAQKVEVRIGPEIPAGDVPSPLPEAPAQWTVGDRIPVTVTLTLPLDPAAAPPAEGIPWPWAEGSAWGGVEVRRPFPPVGPLPLEGEPGHSRYQLRLQLVAFRPGEVALPPLQIPLTPELSVTTPAQLSLPIRSTLEPIEEDPAPSGARAPVGLAMDARFWWLNGSLALLSLGLFLRAWTRRRGLPSGWRHRPEDPLGALERILERLRTEPAAEPFHTRLSLALRRYLGHRLAFPAEESTTPEIAARTRRQLPPPVHDRLGSLLEACDTVKFARGGADERSMAQRRQGAGEVARKVETWWRGRSGG
jgi:hypothetical protein